MSSDDIKSNKDHINGVLSLRNSYKATHERRLLGRTVQMSRFMWAYILFYVHACCAICGIGQAVWFCRIVLVVAEYMLMYRTMSTVQWWHVTSRAPNRMLCTSRADMTSRRSCSVIVTAIRPTFKIVLSRCIENDFFTHVDGFTHFAYFWRNGK